MKNADGTIDLGWKATTDMVEALGPTGMSSDESEVDEKTGLTTYRVRRRLWRAKVCRHRLIVIDKDLNSTNGLGGARPGNPPRLRVRDPNATVSTRTPKVGCAKNFYSKVWLANLRGNRVIEALKMKPAKDLGNLQVEE